ncbi:MAG TPA: carbohydrate binding family 9 domain-containing protein, partial [Gammaproteobacteria bacterium]
MRTTTGIAGRAAWHAALGLAVLLPCTAFASRTLAERQQPLEIRPTTAVITIDAVLDEPVWQEARRITLDYETRPAENIPARVATEGFITYDNKNLYVAFIAHDPDPEKIRAHLSDRDDIGSDDFVGVILDTFNDQRRGFEFFVNPVGVQGDFFQDDINRVED